MLTADDRAINTPETIHWPLQHIPGEYVMAEQLISRKEIAPASIFCVGKNYPKHAREIERMEGIERQESSGSRPEPIIFLKPSTALETSGEILMPSFQGRPLSDDMHYEVELVLLVGSPTDGCSLEEAPSLIRGIGVGLDMTLRDVQFDDRKKGHPWLKSKGFRKSALISDFVHCTPEMLASNPEISLELNGRTVQEGRMKEMIHCPEELLHYLSYLYGLRRDDLIFTGTPDGVGRVSIGDRLSARLSLSGSGRGSAQEIRLEATVQEFKPTTISGTA